MSAFPSNQGFDVLKSILTHVDQLKPFVAKRAIICSGEYLANILMKWSLLDKMKEILPVFVGKSSQEVKGWTQNRFDDYNILGLDTEMATGFWFDVFPQAEEEDYLAKQLKNRTLQRLQNAVLLSLTWDGVSSGLMPALISLFKNWNVNNLTMAIMPSATQPLDAHFNSLSAIGKSLSENVPILLVQRDALEEYVGVSRDGTIIRGSEVINCALEIMLGRDSFVDEIVQLSKSHKVRKYAILPVMGASLELYGSLENMLDSVLLRPLLSFDLADATVACIILRMPIRLKDKISKDNLELSMAKWFKKKGKLRSIHVCEPLYVDDLTDRIDILAFVGGFATAELFTALIKDVEEIKNYAVEQKHMEKEEWNKIVKNLTGM
jgi:hypothetical protein